MENAIILHEPFLNFLYTFTILSQKMVRLENAYQLFTSKTKHKRNLNQEAKKAETKKSYKEPNV